MANYTLPALTLFVLFSWAPKQQAPTPEAEPKGSTAWTVSWSHDDKFIAAGNDKGELAIYETKHWKKIKSWSYKSTTITRVEWNPRHPVLAVAAVWHEGASSIPQLYDMAKNQIIRTIPDSIRGRALSWKPDGEEIAFVGKEGRITIFGRSGEWRKTLSYTNPGALFDIDWHPKKNLILAVEEDIYLLDAEKDRLLATYDDLTKGKGILSCQWLSSGRIIVTGDYGAEQEGGEPSYLKYWSSLGHWQKHTKDSKAEYRNLRWSKDGEYLAAAGDGLLLIDKTGVLIRKTVFGNNVWGVDWNSAGDKIVTSDGAGIIRVVNLQGKVLKRFAL